MLQVEGKHSVKPDKDKGRSKPSKRSRSSSASPAPRPAEKSSRSRDDTTMFRFMAPLPAPLRSQLYLHIFGLSRNGAPSKRYALTYVHPAVTVTQSFTTASLLDSKVELQDLAAKGVKIDIQNLWNPAKAQSAAQKLTFAFKNPNVHARSFVNYAQASGNIDAVVDATFGHEGFLVGLEGAYDVQKAAVTKYSLGLGYQAPTYAANVLATQNLNIIAASFYQRVNEATEVGAKVGYDVQAAAASGLELATKYQLDKTSFAKAKINDRGIAALAYNTRLRTGVALGLGVSLDTNKLNEAGHKIGTSLTFEG